ncbi:MAG: hypothetical protein ACREQV_01790 [Candidatus Binatia bacterium]
MSNRFEFAAALLVCCVAVGCELGDRASRVAAYGEWSGTERDSAGILIVSNPSDGIWTNRTRWTVEKDLSIGMVAGAPEYQFGRVADVAVGEDGRIYVLDQQAARIRVFDAGGSHILSFGSAGRGPGELSTSNPMGAQAVLVTAAGDIVVPDFDNRRLNRFNAEGEFIGASAMRLERGVPVAWSILPGGDYVVHRVQRSPSWNGLLRIDRRGEVLDTIYRFDLQPVPWGISTPTPEGRREALMHSPVWAITRDGRLVSGRSDRYRIEVRNLLGRLQMVILKEHEPLTLSRQQQERYLDRRMELWAEMSRSTGASEGWIQSQLDQGRGIYILPERLPAFTGFTAGPEGTIWVRGVSPIDSMTAHVLQPRLPLREFWSSTWEIFSRNGRFLGEITLPLNFTLHTIEGSYIYGVERDDWGVQRVVRLRIHMP